MSSPTGSSLREIHERQASQAALRQKLSDEALQKRYSDQLLTYLGPGDGLVVKVGDW